MRHRIIWVAAALVLLAPSCKTWVKIPEHKVTIVADSTIKRGADFSFCVTLTDTAGQQVYAATYIYKISWVGVEGSTHKAKTGIYEKIRVKGAVGTATLHILGYDAQDEYGEVAKHTFQVE
jgi:hypothetical protein